MPPFDPHLAALADALDEGTVGFREAVYHAVRQIPRGRVLGYGHVGALIGHPRAARQVGYALAALMPGSDVPWWRVIRSDGSIALQGDPARGPLQIRLLQEGEIAVLEARVDMGRFRWTPG